MNQFILETKIKLLTNFLPFVLETFAQLGTFYHKFAPKIYLTTPRLHIGYSLPTPCVYPYFCSSVVNYDHARSLDHNIRKHVCGDRSKSKTTSLSLLDPQLNSILIQLQILQILQSSPQFKLGTPTYLIARTQHEKYSYRDYIPT